MIIHTTDLKLTMSNSFKTEPLMTIWWLAKSILNPEILGMSEPYRVEIIIIKWMFRRKKKWDEMEFWELYLYLSIYLRVCVCLLVCLCNQMSQLWDSLNLFGAESPGGARWHSPEILQWYCNLVIKVHSREATLNS